MTELMGRGLGTGNMMGLAGKMQFRLGNVQK